MKNVIEKCFQWSWKLTRIEMIKQGKRTISCQERQGYASRDCEWRMCTNSWNRERPFDGRSEDKRSMQWRWRTNGNVFISMQMRVCDASRVKKKRYNRWREIADTLMIRCAETKSREIKILSRLPYYTIQVTVNDRESMRWYITAQI